MPDAQMKSFHAEQAAALETLSAHPHGQQGCHMARIWRMHYNNY